MEFISVLTAPAAWGGLPPAPATRTCHPRRVPAVHMEAFACVNLISECD